MKIIAKNRTAFYDYEILDRYEAGLVLSGREIKAVRAGKVRLDGSFARFLITSNNLDPELFIVNLHIGVEGSDPTRSRKLLLHKEEIDRLRGQIEAKGLSLIPLTLYLKRGLAKIELGLGRGLKRHDKREILRRRDLDREIQQSLRQK